jgi:YVTN family beta-propeller protein
MKKHFSGVVAFFALLAMLLVPASHACSVTFPSDQPADIIYDPSGNRVFASLFMGSSVVQFGHGCVQEKTFSTADGPTGLVFDGTNLWVALYNSNAVEKINVSTGNGTLYTVGTQPRGVAFDGTYIWVSNSGSNTVTKLLASNGFVAATIPVGSYPWGVAVNSSNLQTTVWVANLHSANVSIINTQTNVVTSIATGSEPLFFAKNPYAVNGIIGGDMWVSCYTSQIVEQFTSQGSLIASYAITGHGEPLGLSISPSGVSGATHNGDVFTISPNGVSYTPVGSNNYGVIWDPDSSTLWVTDINQGTIFEISD